MLIKLILQCNKNSIYKCISIYSQKIQQKLQCSNRLTFNISFCFLLHKYYRTFIEVLPYQKTYGGKNGVAILHNLFVENSLHGRKKHSAESMGKTLRVNATTKLMAGQHTCYGAQTQVNGQRKHCSPQNLGITEKLFKIL